MLEKTEREIRLLEQHLEEASAHRDYMTPVLYETMLEGYNSSLAELRSKAAKCRLELGLD